MKKQTCFVFMLAFLIFASLIAFHEANLAAAYKNEPVSSPVYLAPAGTVAGGGYQLQVDSRPVSSAGGHYFLLGPASPALNGGGCCCHYLPCIVKAP